MDKKKVKEHIQRALVWIDPMTTESANYEMAIKMAAKNLEFALEELSKSDWVSVEDGLPDINQDVWVRSIANPDEVWTARRTTRLEYEGDMLDSNGFVNIVHSSITHWKPIEKLED